MVRPNVVAVADEKVSISTALTMLGVEVADPEMNRKVHCPFGGVYHSDGGISPAMRLYAESNSAYCFSCSAYYTPVSLFARARDTNRRDAALYLLDLIGHRPFDRAQAWQQAAAYEPPPDRSMLAEALKTYCRRISPSWLDLQFETEISRLLMHCLSLLELVKTGEDAQLWLVRCKDAMHRTLSQR